MYRNLEAEMVRRGVSRLDIADAIQKRYQAVSLKLNGKSKFTLDETIAIKNKFFPDCDVEFLFDFQPTP